MSSKRSSLHPRFLAPFLLSIPFFLFASCNPSSESDNNNSAKIGLSGITQNFDSSRESWRVLLDGADEAGVSFLHHQMPRWSEAEPQRGVFDFSYFSELTRDVRSEKYEYSVDIATPLGINQIDVPPDLTFTSFGDPELLERYLKYVDASLTIFPRVQYVILHTETVENFFAGNSSSSSLVEYCDFISNTIVHIHQNYPSLKVGVYGTKNESTETLACLNRETDFFGVGYIADRGDDDHLLILRRLLTSSEGKPVVIYEAGIPTSRFLGGSEQRQVDFIDDVSSLITEFGERIVAVSLYQHRDDSQEIVRQYVSQLFPDYSSTQREELIAFFSSLGLKRSDGSHKLGWGRFLMMNGGQNKELG